MHKQQWKAHVLGGLMIALGLGGVGCQKQLFLEPADWNASLRPDIPTSLETSPHEPIGPSLTQRGAQPPTVSDPKREQRVLTLKEAFAIAIEQGNLGSGGANGQDNLALPNFTGRGTSGTDTVKAFVLDPAIAQAEVERSLSKFDARWINSLSWSKQDQATLTLQQSFSNGDSAAFNSSLAKPLPTGGLAGITVSMNYLNLSTPPNAPGFVALNTSYTPRVQFVFEQPLLQGFGVEANQLNPAHPGSLLIPGLRASGGQGSEGVLVTRVRTEQSRAQFDAQINQMLLNVETAYWNLYSAYYQLYAQEEGVKQSYAAYVFYKKRVEAGVEDPSLEPQSLAQYWTFRQNVIDARNQVLSADRTLRGLLGMRSNDGTVLVPADEPALVPFKPDFYAMVDEALQYRPELMIARQEVKAAQLNLLSQKNLRLPDARMFASYDVNGLGPTLGGPRDRDALASLNSNQFNSWQVGFRVDMPIGFRDGNALVRQSQLSLWKAFYQLHDSERKAQEYLTDSLQTLETAWATIQITRANRLALSNQINITDERVKAGSFQAAQYVALLQAQRDLARVTSQEFAAVANYNIALARLEYGKGTIQRYNNIAVADGPLPPHVQKKAEDHFRARNVGLKLREHPAELPLNSLSQYQPMSMDQLPVPSMNGGMPSMNNLQPLTMPSATPGMLPNPTPEPKQMPPVDSRELGAATPAQGTIKAWQDWKPAGATAPMNLPDLPSNPVFSSSGSMNLPDRKTIGNTSSNR